VGFAPTIVASIVAPAVARRTRLSVSGRSHAVLLSSRGRQTTAGRTKENE
jgi:hypothetical protein